MPRYDARRIEPKWQAFWESHRTFRTRDPAELPHADGAKKLWATEYGNAVPDWVDEATQASRLDQAMQAWKTYTWAGNFLEFNLWDSSGSKFGLLRSDWSQRPSFAIFQTNAL